jgi:ABC-type spermidine/putrescine transport system permease subunit II
VIAQVAQTLWVKVERPTFDLVGVIASSLSIALLCAVTALVLGVAAGISVIVRRRRHPPLSFSETSLQLLDARRP